MPTESDLPDFAADVDANIARNVRDAREKQGITQSELARRVTELGLTGFHQTTVARVESQQRSLRTPEAVTVAHVLGLPLEQLVEDKRTGTIRSHAQSLVEKRDVFRMAADDLLAFRMYVARTLDRELPAMRASAPLPEQLAERSVQQQIYESVENLLAETSPSTVLAEMYLQWAGGWSEEDRSAYGKRYENIVDEIIKQAATPRI